MGGARLRGVRTGVRRGGHQHAGPGRVGRRRGAGDLVGGGKPVVVDCAVRAGVRGHARPVPPGLPDGPLPRREVDGHRHPRRIPAGRAGDADVHRVLVERLQLRAHPPRRPLGSEVAGPVERPRQLARPAVHGDRAAHRGRGRVPPAGRGGRGGPRARPAGARRTRRRGARPGRGRRRRPVCLAVSSSRWPSASYARHPRWRWRTGWTS